MATLLITGAQRPVAANLAVVLSSAFDVFAVCDKPRGRRAVLPRLEGCQVTTADSPVELADQIRGVQPNAVIHCGPLSEGSWRPLAIDPNTDAANVCAAAQAACHVEAHFTMFSTDGLFDAPRMFHHEACDAQVAEAPMIRSLEEAALEWGGLVIRTNALAWGTANRDALGDHVLHSLETRSSIDIRTRAYASPVLVDELAEGWLRSFEHKIRGVLHMGGAERVSQARFVERLCKAIDGFSSASTPRLLTSSATNPRHEASLCSRKARDLLGWRPAFLADTIEAFAAQRNTGRFDALGRSEEIAPARAA